MLKSKNSDLLQNIGIHKAIIEGLMQLDKGRLQDKVAFVLSKQNEEIALLHRQINQLSEGYNQDIDAMKSKMHMIQVDNANVKSQKEKLANELFVFRNLLQEKNDVISVLKRKNVVKALNDNLPSNKEVYIASPSTLLAVLNSELIEHKERLFNMKMDKDKLKSTITGYESIIKSLEATIASTQQGLKPQLNIKAKQAEVIEQLSQSKPDEKSMSKGSKSQAKEKESDFYIRQLEIQAEDNLLNLKERDSRCEWAEILKNSHMSAGEFIELTNSRRNKKLGDIIELLLKSIVEKNHQLFLLRKEIEQLHRHDLLLNKRNLQLIQGGSSIEDDADSTMNRNDNLNKDSFAIGQSSLSQSKLGLANGSEITDSKTSSDFRVGMVMNTFDIHSEVSILTGK